MHLLKIKLKQKKYQKEIYISKVREREKVCGHVQNSINGSGSILPSSFPKFAIRQSWPAAEKIRLTRVCQDLPRKFPRSAAVAAFANTVSPSAPPPHSKENGQ